MRSAYIELNKSMKYSSFIVLRQIYHDKCRVFYDPANSNIKFFLFVWTCHIYITNETVNSN